MRQNLISDGENTEKLKINVRVIHEICKKSAWETSPHYLIDVLIDVPEPEKVMKKYQEISQNFLYQGMEDFSKKVRATVIRRYSL